jgi:hypothetical protein
LLPSRNRRPLFARTALIAIVSLISLQERLLRWAAGAAFSPLRRLGEVTWRGAAVEATVEFASAAAVVEPPTADADAFTAAHDSWFGIAPEAATDTRKSKHGHDRSHHEFGPTVNSKL